MVGPTKFISGESGSDSNEGNAPFWVLDLLENGRIKIAKEVVEISQANGKLLFRWVWSEFYNKSNGKLGVSWSPILRKFDAI